MLTPTRRLSIAAFVAAGLAIVFSFLFIANRISHKQASSKSLPAAAKSLGANSPVAAMTDPQVMKAYGQLPLSFEANQGQSAADVKYLSRGNGYLLSLRGQEADLTFRQAPAARPVATNRLRMYRTRRVPRAPEKFSTLRMRLDGSNPSAQITGLDRTATQINYFMGNDPNKWHTDVPAYSKVKYAGIYPGVDLMFYGNRRELEYDFVVAPGADPKSIALNVEGARKIHLDAHGNLLLDVIGGEVKFKKPDVYQDSNGSRREITGNYTITNHEVRFAVADYDRSQPLTIDPVVIYSTYVGGSGNANGGDMAMGIALDSAGDAYIGGITFSPDLKQVVGIGAAPASVSSGGSAGFVAELNPTGTATLYLTYLGGTTGSGTQDGIQAIAVDSSRNIYVTGFTESSDFPLSTVNLPFEPTAPLSINGLGSAFVTRLNTTQSGLAQLDYSSYLGGSGNQDEGNGIAVNAHGDAFVTGVTLSPDFPTANASVAPFSATLLSAEGNAFVSEVNTNGSGTSSLLFSSYLGGNGTGPDTFIFGDSGAGIAVDSSFNAYVVGTTTSGASFPTTGTQIIANGCSKNA
ncbi:MAG: SBBP repeat-containing protein, partial [Candidatus Acidiferrales bacterium]